MRLTFTDYLKAGDSLALDVDLASNRPLAAKVSSYLDSPKEPVTLDVRFSTLDNNATYASTKVTWRPRQEAERERPELGLPQGGQ